MDIRVSGRESISANLVLLRSSSIYPSARYLSDWQGCLLGYGAFVAARGEVKYL
jgi:hypothetical protein